METNVQTTDITNLLNLTIEINNTIQKKLAFTGLLFYK